MNAIHDPMECRACGFTADEADFDVSDEIGARVCPKCGSTECYAQTRDLQCPHCGHVVVNDTSIGAKFCGPHMDARGEFSPAVQMRTTRDWSLFQTKELPNG